MEKWDGKKCVVFEVSEKWPICFVWDSKLYVVLSAVLCLLASGLVAFFLFPRSVVVVDDGIHSVTVHFDHVNAKVLMNLTVSVTQDSLHTRPKVSRVPECFLDDCIRLSVPQSKLNFSNPNFFSVLVQSVTCQVLYMKTVVGSQQMDNVTIIQPLSQTQVLLPQTKYIQTMWPVNSVTSTVSVAH